MRKRNNSRKSAVAGVLLLVGTAVAVFVVRPWGGTPPALVSPPLNGSSPGPAPMKQAGQLFKPDVRELPCWLKKLGASLPGALPAGRPANCGPRRLAGSSGAWAASWLDDSSNPNVLAEQARKVGLLDFFWLTLGNSPTSIEQPSATSSSPPLGTVLNVAQRANPCGLWFVTLVDSQEATRKQMISMDAILLNPKLRVQHVLRVADLMASLRYADGLTVDYEYTLPQNQSDLQLAARVGHLRNLSDAWIADRLTRGMDQLIYDLREVLHRQGRLLRDAVRVRTDNDTDYGNLPPYLEDYYWLGRCADQLVLMTVDYHWDGGDPGPIAPLGWIRQVLMFAQHSPLPGMTPVPFSRLAAEIPAYAYDWPVRADNPAKATGLAATDLATELAHEHLRTIQVQSGETEYTYHNKGQLHVIWSAVTGVVNQVRQIRTWCPQCGVMVFATGSVDPDGSALVARALSR